MAYLLTSHGITNTSIASALAGLLNKPFSESSVCVISTATNGTHGDKSWYIKELSELQALGWQNLFIHDVAGIETEDLQKQLDKSDVLYMVGGKTWYLMHTLLQHNVVELIQTFANTKIYVGSSAGSAIASKKLNSKVAAAFGEEDNPIARKVSSSLNLVDFMLKSHYGSPKHPKRTIHWFKALAERLNYPLYAICDNTALKVIDGQVEVISEGEWELFK